MIPFFLSKSFVLLSVPARSKERRKSGDRSKCTPVYYLYPEVRRLHSQNKDKSLAHTFVSINEFFDSFYSIDNIRTSEKNISPCS